MRLAVVVFLTALVAVPLAAEAAEPPTRWAVTLNGRVVEDYSYGHTWRDPECTLRRSGTTRREWRLTSLRPTVVTVGRSSSHARYRPARLAPVRVTASLGKGTWMEMRQCVAEELQTGSGTCRAATHRTRVRPAFAWSGANRIVFRRRAAPPARVRLCGFDWTVAPKDSWLNIAPGRVDEEVLLAGSRRRVVARADVTRITPLPFNAPPGSAQQDLRVVWTLDFRRLR